MCSPDSYLRKTPRSQRILHSLALRSQEPWLRSCSVRENILFFSKWDEDHYLNTIRSCRLEEDFASWPAGDSTVVGEKGANVSGGAASTDIPRSSNLLQSRYSFVR